MKYKQELLFDFELNKTDKSGQNIFREDNNLNVKSNSEVIEKSFFVFSEDFDCSMKKHLKFIDLFAGIGGIRKGFEISCSKRGLSTECVFTSEIKPHAISVLKQNNPNETIHGDITEISSSEIPNFDFLLAGFPCQAFSSAGKRLGFLDTRGTLFFEVERILRDKKPHGFILENVEGLVSHDKKQDR